MTLRILATAMLAAPLAWALPAAAGTPTGAYHIYKRGLHITPKNAATMLYYAGPVISTVKVAVVVWSPAVSKTIKKTIGPFYSAIVNSTYVDQLVQYSTAGQKGVNGKQGTNQTITRGSYLGKFVITPVNTSKTLTDADVQAEIEGQIASGSLPPQDANTLYMLYFPSNITITLDGLTSCQSFGAYHENTLNKINKKNIYYGVMPDCGGGIADITYASSHEFAEAVTDAIPTPGSNPAYPQAWNTSDGYEIADLCEGDEGTLTAGGKTYVVTQVFDNSKNSCSKGNYTSP